MADFGKRNGSSPVLSSWHAPEWIAVGLTVLWIFAGLLFWLFMPENTGNDTGSALSMLVGIALPIVLIWVAAITVRSIRALRAEARGLRETVDRMRVAMDAAGATRSPEGTRDEDPAEAGIATFMSHRDRSMLEAADERDAAHAASVAAFGTALAPAAEVEEPTLALDTPEEAPNQPVSIDDFVRALNFPDNGEDQEGFRALRRALADRSIAKLIRASQDVLTLLAQDGIYMDDLAPELARPEVWRRFAQGERGREIAAVGGVRDRSSLALTAGRLRADTIFRDAAHHFLRQFDRTFAEFEKSASDQDLIDLANTRTARAFMLLGRVAGIFD